MYLKYAKSMIHAQLYLTYPKGHTFYINSNYTTIILLISGPSIFFSILHNNVSMTVNNL